jgi:hypothetical protein
MISPKVQCQVCGVEVYCNMVTEKAAWTVHRIERNDVIVQVLSCPKCAIKDEETVLVAYRTRVREGLIEGYH